MKKSRDLQDFCRYPARMLARKAHNSFDPHGGFAFSMPGPPHSEPSFEEGANQSEVVASVCEEFGMLVTTLARQIDLVDDPDSPELAALWKAKAAAERGLRLSELLARSIAQRKTRRSN